MSYKGRDVISFPESFVLHRDFAKQYPLIKAAHGSRLFDSAGREFYDASGGGVAATILGQGNQRIVAAAAAQMQLLAFAHNREFANEQQERLAMRLVGYAPENLGKVFFVQDGSSANESALRLTYKYWLERLEPQRDIVVTIETGFHGSTIGTLSLTGRTYWQKVVMPWIIPFQHIKPFLCLRCPYNQTYETCAIDCGSALDDIAQRVGVERIAAILFEPIPLSLAAVVPPPEFLPYVRSWCDINGALLILDEVVTGLGRAGKNFACDHWQVTPDMITVSKTLGAGYSPIGAVIASKNIYRVIDAGTRAFAHGNTFNGNPVSCAVGNAVLDELEEFDLIERSAILGKWIRRELVIRLADNPIVLEVRGAGTLIAIEYCSDRVKRDFLNPALGFGIAVVAAAFDRGLIVSGGQGSAEGYIGDFTTLTPAFNTTDAEAEFIVQTLCDSISEASSQLEISHPANQVPISLGHVL